MSAQTVLTLVNPNNGNLAFKLYSFDDNSHFDHIQRLNYYSAIFLTEGRGKIKSDFTEYDFADNSLMFFSPYQPHMLETKQKISGWVINFHPDFFCIHKHQKEVACHGILFNNIYQSPSVTVSEEDRLKLVEIIYQIRTEMQDASLAQYELLVSYLKIFLINASRIKKTADPQLQDQLSELKEPFILQNLKDAIESNYKVKHAPAEYAELLNVSPKTLGKVAKSYFNKTLTNLISERIIIEAKRELYLTSKTVKEIAFELGFNDEHYFSRFFKNNAAVSPQIYRDTVGYARAEMPRV